MDSAPPCDGRPDLDDDAFLASLCNASMPPETFRHRSHLRLAWLLLHRHGADDGAQMFIAAIKDYADVLGTRERYNETLTRFWLHALTAAVAAHPAAGTLDELIAAVADLDDPGLQYRHWRPETLRSAEARLRWVDPDLAPLPS